jgi:low temperature requirement protein LtrA
MTRFLTPMVARDPSQEHRTASPLELFFDLTFVVAIASAGSSLQAGLTHGEVVHALVGYPLVFFGIWWAWMNFTWFASAYDNDDVAYRVAVLVQMTGVLILAAGVPRALEHWDFAVMVVGYVVMRFAMVSLWLRAYLTSPTTERSARRYAVGIAAVQLLWVGWLVLPVDVRLVVFVIFGVVELMVPIWAEAAGRTAWHPRHIAERYGQFTIIVLGEAILATSQGVRAALAHRESFGQLAPIVSGALLSVFAMWWFYFDMPAGEIVEEVRRVFEKNLSGALAWGYGHYFVFASAAAFGAGVAVAIGQVVHRSQLTPWESGFICTVPVTCYLLTVWALHARYKPPSKMRTFAVPIAVVAILASSFTSQPVLATGSIMTVLVAMTVITQRGLDAALDG